MEVSEVIITNISRETITLMADGEVEKVTAGCETEFEFIYLVGKQSFESKTTLRITENKTISELEELIKDIINNR